MKVICERINAIEGTITRTNASGVIVELDMLSYQIKDLFMQLWNDEGDDLVKEWLSEEGFDMVKMDTLGAKPFTP